MGVLILCVASAISACAYRAGGMSRDITANPKWMPMFLRKSWVRDWLLPAVLLLLLSSFWRPCYLLDWVMLLPYYGLSGAALSTYWDWAFKGKDNYYAHGFGCGLAGLCLITFVPWWILLMRLTICTVGMGWFSYIINFDELEEEVRGIFFIL
jgi:hypothetical protein